MPDVGRLLDIHQRVTGQLFPRQHVGMLGHYAKLLETHCNETRMDVEATWRAHCEKKGAFRITHRKAARNPWWEGASPVWWYRDYGELHNAVKEQRIGRGQRETGSGFIEVTVRKP